MTLTARIADFRAAIDFVETMGVDRNRIGAVGSSFGGMVVLAAGGGRLEGGVGSGRGGIVVAGGGGRPFEGDGAHRHARRPSEGSLWRGPTGRPSFGPTPSRHGGGALWPEDAPPGLPRRGPRRPLPAP